MLVSGRLARVRIALSSLLAVALALGLLFASPPPAQAAEPRPIAEIQGTGAATPLNGQQVTTEPSVVTAVYPAANRGFNGFVIQTPGTGGDDKDPAEASDAIFVYGGRVAFDVEIGDVVSVTGKATEFNGLTEIELGSVTVVDADVEPVEPVTVDWADTAAERENYESMLYASDATFLVSDTYPLLQYGELGLAAGDELPVQPTEVGAPGSDAAAEQAATNAAIRVTLDDGTNRSLAGGTLPYLKPGEGVTVGDTLTLTEPVIIDWRNNAWKFNPTAPVQAGGEIAEIDPAGTPEAPEVGGDFSIASFNVLNYFTTTGQGRAGCTGGNAGSDGPNVTFDCDVRGAWDAEDLKRQQAKIITAINDLDASVTGLMEIENSARLGEPTDEATRTLVTALNQAAGEEKWAFVPSSTQLQPVSDQDFITNAIIYQPAEVTLNGKALALGEAAGDDGPFGNARTPIAASFTAAGGGAPTVVVVNHFKSKSGDGATGDNADSGDGQGAYNGDRTRQAEALVDWLPELRRSARTNAIALLGDFNSYSQEDPMRILYRAGFAQAAPADQYSYSFSGLAGSLDHILINRPLAQRVADAAVWNINAGESIALEYSRYKTTAVDYYTADARRASDHDPVIMGVAAGKGRAVTKAAAAAGELTLLNLNDFHGRIAPESPNTVAVFGTIEQLREQAGEDNTLFLSAGDNIGASLFASSIQADAPTIDVLNAAELAASAVGNHEFDRGFADLTGRVDDRADWTYLGANVYRKGTTTPALPEYATFEKAGRTVAVIGAVTSETRSLVSPDGIAEIDFGDPVAAVNRVAQRLSDGDDANGEADVIIAEYHEGAVEGEPNGTLADEVAKGGMFAKIVNQTSAEVAAIFTAHTHQAYVWDGPIPGVPGKTRPILQSESYGALVGKVTLRFDDAGAVASYTAENVEITETPNEELINAFPRVKEISEIVTAALDEADELGSEVIGETTAPLTRASIATDEGPLEDRAAESTISNLVANMFREQLSDPQRGGAQIGVQNPGGNRADLDQGDITYSEAAAVLPFANTLVTADLTGAQFKTLLEQQWQTNADGSPFTGTRPYLQLGLSDNVSYTYDWTAPQGERITSITIDGKPYDSAATYRVGTASFLAAGGDNFHVFADATDKRDSGLIDLDSWTEYVKAASPISPSFAKQAVALKPLPTELAVGEHVELQIGSTERTSGGPLNTIDFTGDAPPNTSLEAKIGDRHVGAETVDDGAATLWLEIPPDFQPGRVTVVIEAYPSGTKISIPLTIAGTVVPEPSITVSPSTASPGDRVGVEVAWFEPGSPVQITMHSETVDFGELVADDDGSAVFVVTIPEDTELGEHEFVATSGDLEARTKIVIVAADDGSGGGPGELPNTGSDIGLWLLIIAGIAVLGGAALLITSLIRRRRASVDES